MQRRLRNLTFAMLLAGIGYGPLALAQAAPPPPEQTAPDPETTPETVPEDEVPAEVLAAANLLSLAVQIDEDARLTPNGATFEIDGTTVTLVMDMNADRMRLFSQIAPSDDLPASQLRRMMQANFDTALDARYAIAQGQLWSTFIHPLTSLTQDDFVSALAQTVTLVKTYGTTYSSGAMSFGGGDSNAEIQKLLESFLDPEKEI